jgi:hypothetical protein
MKHYWQTGVKLSESAILTTPRRPIVAENAMTSFPAL